MICWKLTKILAPQIREILQTFVNFRIFAVLCLRLFKTYHFQTWQVYPLKTLLTKQKIRQKQLAFCRYFKQRNRHSSEIRRFFGGGQVCSHQPQTTTTNPPPPAPTFSYHHHHHHYEPPLLNRKQDKSNLRFPVISNSQTVVIRIFNFKKGKKQCTAI